MQVFTSVIREHGRCLKVDKINKPSIRRSLNTCSFWRWMIGWLARRYSQRLLLRTCPVRISGSSQPKMQHK